MSSTDPEVTIRGADFQMAEHEVQLTRRFLDANFDRVAGDFPGFDGSGDTRRDRR
jgi:hypothetical protein